ncbi:MAG: SMP-30/gluconolactonase/LRE family protein [Chloroflexi bacterium]|nr:SMP-30/gluconolactonase/LRE family protein [Chloroflexota bacterium]
MQIEQLASGLGWPEGPALLPDGRLVFVESYRSQLSVYERASGVQRYAYTAGAPNSSVLGADGAVYVCQNGGTVGPWRAAEMTKPSIQRVDREGAAAEIIATEIEGIALNGPNDLVFGADGRLYFTDPGTYRPADPEPSYIFALEPDGTGRVVIAFPKPVFPNGVAVEDDGSIVWDESYTGHVRRRRPDGSMEDLGRMPGDNPILDGIKIGADGRLYVTDITGAGIHVLTPSGEVEEFITCGNAATNCAFDGEALYMTDAGVPADSADPSFGGALWRIELGRAGQQLHPGRIG